MNTRTRGPIKNAVLPFTFIFHYVCAISRLFRYKNSKNYFTSIFPPSKYKIPQTNDDPRAVKGSPIFNQIGPWHPQGEYASKMALFVKIGSVVPEIT